MHNDYLDEVRKSDLMLYRLLIISLGISGLFISSQITIPIEPVPVVLVTIILMVIGLTYETRDAAITVSLYLFFGILGLPMFKNFSSGFAYFMGPTGGYLVGYLLCVISMSYFKNRFNISDFFACVIGNFFLYVPGILWLSRFISFEDAIYKGFILFIPSGIVKIFLLVGLMHILRKPIKDGSNKIDRKNN